jgi:hypothetical protein
MMLAAVLLILACPPFAKRLQVIVGLLSCFLIPSFGPFSLFRRDRGCVPRAGNRGYIDLCTGRRNWRNDAGQ